jgi:hypothetical protein
MTPIASYLISLISFTSATYLSASNCFVTFNLCLLQCVCSRERDFKLRSTFLRFPALHTNFVSCGLHPSDTGSRKTRRHRHWSIRAFRTRLHCMFPLRCGVRRFPMANDTGRDVAWGPTAAWRVFEGLLLRFWMICWPLWLEALRIRWLHEEGVLNGEFHLTSSSILFLIGDHRYIVL